MGAQRTAAPAPDRPRANRLGLLLAAGAFVLCVGVGREVGGWLFGPTAASHAPTAPAAVAPTATPVPTPRPGPVA